MTLKQIARCGAVKEDLPDPAVNLKKGQKIVHLDRTGHERRIEATLPAAPTSDPSIVP